MTDTPNPIDLHVGGMIRTRRKILGVSQERLADDLGLTFQQVQKYERGANRVSASKLYEIAKSLRTSVGYFFEGLHDPATAVADGETDSGADTELHAFLMTAEGLDLAAAFPRLPRRHRTRLLALIREMAAGAADEPEEAEAELRAAA